MSSTGNSNQQIPSKIHVEDAVRERYSAASQSAEPALCCAVQYDAKMLDVLPDEIIERDYGCGDPSTYVQQGDTVLDLGSGGGKICYIASQVVGPEGKVWGVDMNDDMLDLARKYQKQVGEKIGWHNVKFFKGRIQDLKLDLDQLEEQLKESPISDVNGWLETQKRADELRNERPMIADDSVDVVVSNCVLNLVSPNDRRQLFAELHRVLKRGGRAVISDIVCDEPVPEHLQHDAKLWSGCISGAFQEHEFLQAFTDVGFYGAEIVERQAEPWTTVEGIEFRSMTVRAFKGKEGPCNDHHQAIIYQGPWRSVTDDDGHILRRGYRTAVCKKTFEIYTRAPYADQIVAVQPRDTVSDADAKAFDCHTGQLRDPKETKGKGFSETVLPVADCCGPSDCC